MPDCVFCSIVDGKSPAHRVHEDEATLAFLDVEPAARGHTLVIPKAHRERLTDMRGALVGDVFQTVQRVAAALESTYDLGGISVVQSNGRAAGQEICHAHVHVVPRTEGDDVRLRWNTRDIDEADQREAAAALRDALSS